MDTFIFVLHVISCLILIGLILIQKGQGANMGAAFGGSSQTVFGSKGPATFLNKLTIVVAVIFLGASLYLANAAKRETASTVVDQATKIHMEQETAEGEIDVAPPVGAEEETAPATEKATEEKK